MAQDQPTQSLEDEVKAAVQTLIPGASVFYSPANGSQEASFYIEAAGKDVEIPEPQMQAALETLKALGGPAAAAAQTKPAGQATAAAQPAAPEIRVAAREPIVRRDPPKDPVRATKDRLSQAFGARSTFVQYIPAIEAQEAKDGKPAVEERAAQYVVYTAAVSDQELDKTVREGITQADRDGLLKTAKEGIDRLVASAPDQFAKLAGITPKELKGKKPDQLTTLKTEIAEKQVREEKLPAMIRERRGRMNKDQMIKDDIAQKLKLSGVSDVDKLTPETLPGAHWLVPEKALLPFTNKVSGMMRRQIVDLEKDRAKMLIKEALADGGGAATNFGIIQDGSNYHFLNVKSGISPQDMFILGDGEIEPDRDAVKKAAGETAVSSLVKIIIPALLVSKEAGVTKA